MVKSCLATYPCVGLKECQRRLHGRGCSSGETRKRGAPWAGRHDDPDAAAAQRGRSGRPEARRGRGPSGADRADAGAERSAGAGARGQAAAVRTADPQVRIVTQHVIGPLWALSTIVGFLDISLLQGCKRQTWGQHAMDERQLLSACSSSAASLCFAAGAAMSTSRLQRCWVKLAVCLCAACLRPSSSGWRGCRWASSR